MDTGVDDALALAYLLAHTDTEIVGISATYGNVDAPQALRNTRNILSMFAHNGYSHAAHIPTALGSRRPTWARGFVADAGCATFHGQNGLGNITCNESDEDSATIHPQLIRIDTDTQSFLVHRDSLMDEHTRAQLNTLISIGGYALNDPHALPAPARCSDDEPITSLEHVVDALNSAQQYNAQPADGVHMIIDAVRRYRENITVVATGPLTDIAAAFHAAPDIIAHTRLVFMGGTLTQEGNCYDAVSETNIIQDPEAARDVVISKADVTMIGLDVTHQCLFGPAHAQSWQQSDNPAWQTMADLAQFSIQANRSADAIFTQGMPLHDPLAAAVALDPSLIHPIDIAMTVETCTADWQGVRGRTIGNPAGLNNPNAPRVHVALGVDAPRFLHDMTQLPQW